MMDFDLLFDRSDLPYVLKQAKTLSKEECRAIYNYFEEYKPKRILEFGTQYGCSTRVFIEISKWFGIDLEVHSWDINDQIRSDCVDRNSFTFHKEDITGKEKYIIDTFRPDLVFLDAHPYELTKNLMTVCIEKDINFMCHDVSMEIYERAKLRSDNFTNKSLETKAEWELFLLSELISPLIMEKECFENEYFIVSCFRDRYGLAIIESKIRKIFNNIVGNGLFIHQKNTKVVYTVIFGDKDRLKEPEYIDEGWDWICITDNELIKSEKWNVIYVPLSNKCNLDVRQKYKLLKMFPHLFLPHEKSLWIDGSMQIYESINELEILLNNSNIVFYSRGCNFYQESKILTERTQNKDHINNINKQINNYRRLGYPEDSFYAATGVLLRKHNEKDVVVAMKKWWNEFMEFYSGRDQLSFSFSLWELKTKFDFIPGLYPRGNRKTKYFKIFGHNGKGTVKCR